jgi:hypothetical protein
VSSPLSKQRWAIGLSSRPPLVRTSSALTRAPATASWQKKRQTFWPNLNPDHLNPHHIPMATKLKASSLPITITAYQRAIDAAARTVSGIPRAQLEAIVAAAITAIGKPDEQTR